jgi:hypothetical protein
VRRQLAAYSEIIPGRPDLDWYKSGRSTPRPGVTVAKRHPPYVHGKIGMAQLLHKVMRLELRWYEVGPDGHHMRRLHSPSMMATTVCGHVFYIGTRAQTCEMPKPDTVMCGRCHGTGPNFGKHGINNVSRQEAKVRLGCVPTGELA